MKSKFILSLFFSFFVTTISFSHNIWIETNAIGKSGKEHSAKIYLGGYGENERDSVSKWFSNTRTIEIWLAKPDGAKEKLTTKAAGNYLEVLFTPSKEGVYTLFASHELADVYGPSKTQYYASSQVRVGSSEEGLNNIKTVTEMPVQLVTAKPSVKKNATIKVTFKDTNLDKTAVSVCSPKGWVKGLETQNGMVTFEVLWPGLYVIEAYYTEKAEGNHNGKDYKVIKHIATYSLTIDN